MKIGKRILSVVLAVVMAAGNIQPLRAAPRPIVSHAFSFETQAIPAVALWNHPFQNPLKPRVEATEEIVHQPAHPETIEVRPVVEDYVHTPIEKAFNWTEALAKLPLNKKIPIVIFSSKQLADIDDKRLEKLDEDAHQEALRSGGLITYFRGKLTKDSRECISFCLWESWAQARAASKLPLHKAAVRAASQFYESFTLEKYTIEKIQTADGVRIEFNPVSFRHPPASLLRWALAASRGLQNFRRFILPPNYHPAKVIALGLVTGVLSSLLGIGGGPLITMALVLFFTFEAKNASATSSASLVSMSLFGAILTQILQPHTIHWPTMITVSAASVAMTQYLKDKEVPKVVLRPLLGGVVLLIGLKYVISPSSNYVSLTTLDGHPHLVQLGQLVLGAILGSLHQILGIGGGTVATPVFTLFFGLSFADAGATSLAVVAITAIASTFTFSLTKGLKGFAKSKPTVHWPLAKSLGFIGVVGSTMGAFLKVWLQQLPNYHDSTLKRFFGEVLLTLVALLAYQVFKEPKAAPVVAPPVPSASLSLQDQAVLEQLGSYDVGEPILLRTLDAQGQKRYVLGRLQLKVLPEAGREGVIVLDQTQFAQDDFTRASDGTVSLPLAAGHFPEIVEGDEDFLTVKAYLATLPPHQQALIKTAYLSPEPRFIQTVAHLTETSHAELRKLKAALALSRTTEETTRVLQSIHRIADILSAEDDNAVANLLKMKYPLLLLDRESEIIALAARIERLLPAHSVFSEFESRHLNAFIAAQEDLRLLKGFGGISADGMIYHSPQGAVVNNFSSGTNSLYFDAIIEGAGPNGIQAALQNEIAGQHTVVISAAKTPMDRWFDDRMNFPSMRTDSGRMLPDQSIPRALSQHIGASLDLPQFRLLSTLARWQVQALTGRDFRGIPPGGDALALNEAISAAPSRAETVRAYVAALRSSGAKVLLNDPIVSYSALHDEDGDLHGVEVLTRSGRRFIAPQLILAPGIVGLKGGNATIDPYFETNPRYLIVRHSGDFDSLRVRKALERPYTKAPSAPRDTQFVVPSSLASYRAVEQLVLDAPTLTIGIEGGRESALKTAVHYFNILPADKRSQLKIHLFTRTPIEVTDRPVGLHTYKSRFYRAGRMLGEWLLRFATRDQLNAGQISKQSYTDLDFYVKRGQIIIHSSEGKPFDEVWRRETAMDPKIGWVTKIFDKNTGHPIAQVENFWVPALGYNSTSESSEKVDKLVEGGLIDVDDEGNPIEELGPKGALYLKGPGANVVAILGASQLNSRVTLQGGTGAVPAEAHAIALEALAKRLYNDPGRHGPINALFKTTGTQPLSALQEQFFHQLLDIFHDPDYSTLVGPNETPAIVHSGAFTQERQKNKKTTSHHGTPIQEEQNAARAFLANQSLYGNLDVELIPGWRAALGDPLPFINALRRRNTFSSGLQKKLSALDDFVRSHDIAAETLTPAVAFLSNHGLILDQADYPALFSKRSSVVLTHRVQRLFGSPEEWGKPAPLILQIFDWAYVVDALDQLAPPEQVQALAPIDAELHEHLPDAPVTVPAPSLTVEEKAAVAPLYKEFYYAPEKFVVRVSAERSTLSDTILGGVYETFKSKPAQALLDQLAAQYVEENGHDKSKENSITEVDVRLTSQSELNHTYYYDQIRGRLVLYVDPVTLAESNLSLDHFRPGTPPAEVTTVNEFIGSRLDWYANVHRGTGPNSIISTKRLDKAGHKVLFSLGIPTEEQKDYLVIFNSDRIIQSLKNKALIRPDEFTEIHSNDRGLPLGIGVLVVRKDNIKDDLIAPPWQGGGTVDKVTRGRVIYIDKLTADYFQPGTPPVVAIETFAESLVQGSGWTVDVDPALTANHLLSIPSVAENLGWPLWLNPLLSLLIHVPVLSAWLKSRDQAVLFNRFKAGIIGYGQEVVGGDGGVYTHDYFDMAASALTTEPIANVFMKALSLPKNQYAKIVKRAESAILDFLGASSKKYGFDFAQNTSEAVNVVAHAAAEYAKAHEESPVVLTSAAEHTAMNVTFRVDGIARVVLDVDDDGFISPQDLEKRLKEYNEDHAFGNARIRLVALSGASNVEGTGVLTGDPGYLEKIVAITHHYGAELLVDAAQATAHRPIETEKTGIDHLAFSGHKMFTPFAVGGVISRKESKFYSAIVAEKTNEDRIAIAGLAALTVGLNWLKRIGLETIQQEEQELTQYTLKQLKTVDDLQILSANPDDISLKEGIFLVNIKGISNDKLAKALADRGLSVRNGCFCNHERTSELIAMHKIQDWGAVRISLGIYNTKASVDRLVTALAWISANKEKVAPSESMTLVVDSDAQFAGVARAIRDVFRNGLGKQVLNSLASVMSFHQLNLHFLKGDGRDPSEPSIPGTLVNKVNGTVDVWIEPETQFNGLDMITRIGGILTRIDRHNSEFQAEDVPPATVCAASSVLKRHIEGFLPLQTYERIYTLKAAVHPDRIFELSVKDRPAGLRHLFQIQGADWLSYVLIAEDRTAIVIDPAFEDTERIAELLKKNGARLAMIFETHRHAEHRTGARVLRWAFEESHPDVVVGAWSGAEGADVIANEGSEFLIGSKLILKVLETPGHTRGCVSYVLFQKGEKPSLIFSGDAFLVNTPGRTDFAIQGGSAEDIYDSGKKLLGFDDSTLLLPAHRTDWKEGVHLTTVGEEKKEFAVDKETFVKAMNAEAGSALPIHIEQIIHYNSDLSPLNLIGILRAATVVLEDLDPSTARKALAIRQLSVKHLGEAA